MRVLLASSLGGLGHLEPVVAVARALSRAGHEAVVMVPPSLAAAVERTGVRHVVGGEPPRSFVDAIWERVRSAPGDAGLIDRELFADRCTQAMLAPARAVRDTWQPDVIVREPCEYASAVAACEAGIAQAAVGISLAALERGVLEMVTPIVERFCPGVAEAIATAPYLTAFPASLDPSPWPDTRRFRAPGHAARRLPDWWPDGERPLVYVTFGSVVGHLPEATGVFRTALAAVAGLPARVLLTVGRAVDPGDLGPVPENTHVEQWVPQADVLAHARLAPGPSGTTWRRTAPGSSTTRTSGSSRRPSRAGHVPCTSSVSPSRSTVGPGPRVSLGRRMASTTSSPSSLAIPGNAGSPRNCERGGTTSSATPDSRVKGARCVRSATTTVIGTSAATAPLTEMSPESTATSPSSSTVSRCGRPPATAVSRWPAHVVTPVASSASPTTNSEAMKMTVGSPNPANAPSTETTPPKYRASAAPSATSPTASRLRTNSATAAPRTTNVIVASLVSGAAS